MALTARLSLAGPPESDPEDFLATSLGVIFPDDVTNLHGDADRGLIYTSPHLPKPLQISLADPKGERDRSLFSHHLWNSSLLLAELIEAGTLRLPGTDTELAESTSDDAGVDAAPASEFNIAGLATLELGAGTSLPSIMSVLLGARRVLVTDYPAPVVIDMVSSNVASNTLPGFSPLGSIRAREGTGGGVNVEGHSWGELETPLAVANKHAFDRIFVADCLWMPWQHENLQRSIAWFLGDDGTSRAWVVAGFHTGREKMRGFFDAEALKEVGLEVERIWERDCDGVDRAWVWDRGFEDPTVRKRWLVIAVLRRVSSRTPGTVVLG